MAVRFILMMVLIMEGSADPVPDPDIIVRVDQYVGNGDGGDGNQHHLIGNGGLGCWFDNKHHPVGFILKSECMELVCQSDGQWNFTGNFINDCQNCTVGQSTAQIIPYDEVMGLFGPSGPSKPTGNYFIQDSDGVYVLSQSGFGNYATSPFGVFGNFMDSKTCPFPSDSTYNNCLNGAAYREASIKVELVPHPGGIDPPITVHVNGHQTSVLIFRTNYLTSIDDLNCVVVVGTKGLSVGLCMVKNKGPAAYVFALPSLQTTKPKDTHGLYGLCNTFTGSTAQGFVDRSGASTGILCNTTRGPGCILNNGEVATWIT